MKYINGYELRNLLKTESPKVFFHLLEDPNKHPINTKLSLAFILTQDGEYFTTFSHPDYSVESDADLALKNCVVYNMKSLIHTSVVMEDCYDCGYEWDPDYYLLDKIQSFTNRIGNVPNITSVIPIATHLASFEVIKDKFKDILLGYIKNSLGNRFKVMYHDIIPSMFADVEAVGVCVDVEKFNSTFGKPELIVDGLVYTQYNLFTLTGRPSNAFGGVNYAALNKSDGSRECFISRYEDGVLVNVDFKSYHLHLISKELNLSLPDDIHRDFGKIYFQTDNLTDEQYNESKSITFKNLYGYALDEYGKMNPFFEKIEEYKASIWEKYENDGVLITKYGRFIQIENPTPNLVFNYYMQALETEMGVYQIYSMVRRGFHPILYTYDSMLFDVEKDRVEQLIQATNYLTYPFSVSTGKDLHNLTPLQLSN